MHGMEGLGTVYRLRLAAPLVLLLAGILTFGAAKYIWMYVRDHELKKLRRARRTSARPEDLEQEQPIVIWPRVRWPLVVVLTLTAVAALVFLVGEATSFPRQGTWRFALWRYSDEGLWTCAVIAVFVLLTWRRWDLVAAGVWNSRDAASYGPAWLASAIATVMCLMHWILLAVTGHGPEALVFVSLWISSLGMLIGGTLRWCFAVHSPVTGSWLTQGWATILLALLMLLLFIFFLPFRMLP